LKAKHFVSPISLVNTLPSFQQLKHSLCVAAAAEAAGKEASKAMIAQFGRAKTLGEACIGFPDAGACSVVIMLNTMRDWRISRMHRHGRLIPPSERCSRPPRQTPLMTGSLFMGWETSFIGPQPSSNARA
jgi:hypothetical protein